MQQFAAIIIFVHTSMNSSCSMYVVYSGRGGRERGREGGERARERKGRGQGGVGEWGGGEKEGKGWVRERKRKGWERGRGRLKFYLKQFDYSLSHQLSFFTT